MDDLSIMATRSGTQIENGDLSYVLDLVKESNRFYKEIKKLYKEAHMEKTYLISKNKKEVIYTH